PGSIRIVVINLKRSTRRRAACQSKLAEHGLQAEYFEACDAASPDQSWFEQQDPEAFLVNTGRHATAGELACFASHKALWQRCVRERTPILIMEDDFKLSQAFPAAVSSAAQLVDEYGFIRLQSETRARSRTIRSMGDFQLRLYSKVPHSMMCYALSPNAAAGLLAHCDTFSAPVDVFVKQFWLHRQAIYGLKPYTVTESSLSSESRIGHREKAPRGPVPRVLRQLTRYIGALKGAMYSRRLRRQVNVEQSVKRDSQATDGAIAGQTVSR
ncbi:MAG: glycosyltransferase family 25 protein, partial [Pseudomonadota bacterium]